MSAPLPALVPQALSAQAFLPYGEVIETPAHEGLSINNGTAVRHDDLSRADTGHEDGHTGISLFVAQPRSLPITLTMLERHPLGSQAFVPLDGQAFIVVVAPGAAQAPGGQAIAFIARAGQGINFRRGVWHHPLIALGKPGRFLVVDRVGPGNNLETIAIDPISLTLAH